MTNGICQTICSSSSLRDLLGFSSCQLVCLGASSSWTTRQALTRSVKRATRETYACHTALMTTILDLPVKTWTLQLLTIIIATRTSSCTLIRMFIWVMRQHLRCKSKRSLRCARVLWDSTLSTSTAKSKLTGNGRCTPALTHAGLILTTQMLRLILALL